MKATGLNFLLALCLTLPLGSCKKTDNLQDDAQEPEEPAIYQATLLLDAQAALGEGPIWHPGEQKLYWVDIEGRKLHILDPQTLDNQTIETGQRIGTVVPAVSGGAVVALQNGVHMVNTQDGTLTLLANPLEGLGEVRLNDGKADPAGRLWVGSMRMDGTSEQAALYRIEPSGESALMLGGVTISNGIVWTKDQKTMYYIDTPTRKVRAFDYDKTTGGISNERVAVEIPQEMGSPDGMAIDENDHIWIGMWGGFAITHWNPATGELLGKVEVPAQNVTACAFGGEDFSTLYITTARIGTKPEVLEQYPHCGSVFVVKPGVKGVPSHFFAK
jgi:sugar lactone lactonase YvrE